MYVKFEPTERGNVFKKSWIAFQGTGLTSLGCKLYNLNARSPLYKKERCNYVLIFFIFFLIPGFTNKCAKLHFASLCGLLDVLSVGSSAGREVAEGRSVGGERFRR